MGEVCKRNCELIVNWDKEVNIAVENYRVGLVDAPISGEGDMFDISSDSGLRTLTREQTAAQMVERQQAMLDELTSRCPITVAADCNNCPILGILDVVLGE